MNKFPQSLGTSLNRGSTVHNKCENFTVIFLVLIGSTAPCAEMRQCIDAHCRGREQAASKLFAGRYQKWQRQKTQQEAETLLDKAN